MGYKVLTSVLFAGCLFPLSAAAQTAAASSTCLSYEPTLEKLTGKLVRQTFAGPPNYESVQKGDRPETHLLVDLFTPVCVNEDKQEPDLNPEQRNVKRIQLVIKPEAYKQYSKLVGKRVVAMGTLFGEHTGHHHTPVLLTVRTVESAE